MTGQNNPASPRRSARLYPVYRMVCCLVAAYMAFGSADAGSASPVVNSAIPSYVPVPEITGNFVIAGSDTMQPVLLQLATRFRQLYRNTKIGIQTQGTEKGLEQFRSDLGNMQRGDALAGLSGQQVSGSLAILASSRQLTATEINDFRVRNGYEPTEIPIAMGAVVIYVHKENPIEGLSLEQLDAIFGKDRKRGYGEDILTWGQVGLRESWAQQAIHLYGRDAGSATRTIMKNIALLDGEFKRTVREEPGSASQILAIGRDPLAIGYVGIGFQTSAVRPVPLAEKTGMPYVAPTADSVAGGSYPIGRFLYLYAKKESGGELKPIIREFLKFANSREGQEAVSRAGLFPLTSDQVVKNLQAVGGLTAAAASTITAGSSH